MVDRVSHTPIFHATRKTVTMSQILGEQEEE